MLIMVLMLNRSQPEIIQEMIPGSKIELLRVDRLLVIPDLLDALTEAVV